VNLRRELGREHSLDLVLAVTRHETAKATPDPKSKRRLVRPSHQIQRNRG
jgi:hypothetical protein